MALTDESGTSTTMLVQPSNFGGGYSNGFGDFGNGGAFWILLLFILLGGGRWGNSGYGGGTAGVGDMYPWMNQSNQINSGFRDQMISANIDSIQSGINGIQTQLCNGFAGVNQTVANGFAQAEIADNARQMANMQTAFAGQTAMSQGFNALGTQFANCCCENRLASADLKYTIATENCADRSAISDGVRDLIASQNAGTQRILDQLCADKIEQKNDIIAQLRSELMYARGQASQDVQTAAIQAGQRGLANEIEQYVLPTPRPAYIVQNPNCCNQTACGCGCGTF